MTPPSESLYREISLTQEQLALIDSDDFDRISAFRWHAHWQTRMGMFYAVRVAMFNGKKIIRPMQNEVLSIPLGSKLEGDHINPSLTLDNRKSNLRIATRSQQLFHRRIMKNNQLGYKGVSPLARRPNFVMASIGVNGKKIYLGAFHIDRIEEAAMAYDKAAIQYFGDFAVLNFPI